MRNAEHPGRRCRKSTATVPADVSGELLVARLARPSRIPGGSLGRGGAMIARSAAARVLAVGALAVLVAVGAATPASAADFILYSQNLLRFGHGSKTATKCTELANKIGAVDVI